VLVLPKKGKIIQFVTISVTPEHSLNQVLSRFFVKCIVT